MVVEKNTHPILHIAHTANLNITISMYKELTSLNYKILKEADHHTNLSKNHKENNNISKITIKLLLSSNLDYSDSIKNLEAISSLNRIKQINTSYLNN